MKPAPFAPALLARLGYAVFEDAASGVLSPVGELPDWFARAFGEDAIKDGKFVPGDSSPFLENFLTEAEAVWNGAAFRERAESGAWIERGPHREEIALEAEAFLLDGRRILLVANHQERYDDRVRTLQTARDEMLGHERLLREIQTKEVLLHCIVHDLSQPLTALRGCLSLLGMGLPPEKLREVVEIADRQTRRQEGMIRDVLKVFASEMAALQSGTASAGVNAAQCARQVVEEYAAAFASQGASLALDPQLKNGVEWRVVGEPERMRRLFTNFLENALRYSPAGTTVTVGIEEDGEFLRAFVDDQGPGLPEGVTAATLFRLFGKGKESKGKAGLGLYFCKITAERWGGGVGCENRTGGGTRFWFRLPRVRTAEQPEKPPLAPVVSVPQEAKNKAKEDGAAPNLAASSPGPLHILLAEDVEINRRISEELLSQAGHRVTSVEDGRAAVAAVQREGFDLVLMDVEMPEMDGLEATRAIRAWESGRASRIPILAVSGHDTPEDRQRILQAGMDGHLVKPFDGDALDHAIAGLLSNLQQRTTPLVSAAHPSESRPAREAAEIRLLARFGGDARLAASLAHMFLKDSPRLLGDVRDAVERRDSPRLARSAHALKGAVGNFGAVEAREAAAVLERMGRDDSLLQANEALEHLAAQVSALCTELSSFAGTKPGKSPEGSAARRASNTGDRGASRNARQEDS